MWKRLLKASLIALIPAQTFAASEALKPDPSNETHQLEFLVRCAGLVRAMQTGLVDINHCWALGSASFYEKSKQIHKVIRPRTMDLFGFGKDGLAVLDEDRQQTYHATVLSNGVDRLIQLSAGFYETMEQFRESAPEWGEIIVKDLETCRAAEFQ